MIHAVHACVRHCLSSCFISVISCSCFAHSEQQQRGCPLTSLSCQDSSRPPVSCLTNPALLPPPLGAQFYQRCCHSPPTQPDITTSSPSRISPQTVPGWPRRQQCGCGARDAALFTRRHAAEKMKCFSRYLPYLFRPPSTILSSTCHTEGRVGPPAEGVGGS